MMRIVIIFILFFSMNAYSQSVVGIWKTIDDESGEAKSHIQIFESGGKIYGKVLKLLTNESDGTCKNCKGALKDKPIVGMQVMNGLTKKGNEYSGGKILDPKSGKEYSCIIALESADKLKVRGFIGFSLIGRTQYWYRVK